MSITLEKHLCTCFTCDAKAGQRVRPEDAFESAAPIATFVGKGEKQGNMDTTEHAARPPEILVVDDAHENLRLLVEILKKQGYVARPARSGKSGLRSARSNPPDLILLDILMPGMDGFQVCRELKEHEPTKDIPVIFITALKDLQGKIEGFAAGGADYILKPFEKEEVLARVETHLTIRRLQRDLQEENARFKALEKASFEGIFIHDGGRILEVNSRLCDMCGYRREELIGKSALDFVPPASKPLYRRRLEAPDDTILEEQIVRKDGSTIPVQLQGASLVWGGRSVRVVAVRDQSFQRRLENQNRAFKNVVSHCHGLGPLVGSNAAMSEVFKQVADAAATDYGVMITGESGTGKELAARTIHMLSQRADQPFLPVNCGAVAQSLFEREFFGHVKGAFTGAEHDRPGYFDLARGGTMLLDEVGELPHSMQIKLLRALESREYMPVGGAVPKAMDVRIIAVTNRDLDELRRKELLRDDFYYRLHVLHIHIPPLRERRDDIPLLANHLLRQECGEKAPPPLASRTLTRMVQCDWPGNVRELRNVLQSYIATGRMGPPGQDSPDAMEAPAESTGLLQALEEYEKGLILQALRKNNGNKSATAASLKITRQALYNKLKKYDIELI